MGNEIKHRIFIGTFVKNDDFSKKYPKIIADFSKCVIGKWVELWNLHFTYHFLGETNSKTLEKLKIDLRDFLKEYAFDLKFKGMGAFPNFSSPRVLFVNIIDENRILNDIHTGIKEILQNFEFQLDEREYHPHLTLLRIKSVNKSEFRKLIQSYQDTPSFEIKGFQVNLIESKLTPRGPMYHIID